MTEVIYRELPYLTLSKDYSRIDIRSAAFKKMIEEINGRPVSGTMAEGEKLDYDSIGLVFVPGVSVMSVVVAQGLSIELFSVDKDGNYKLKTSFAMPEHLAEHVQDLPFYEDDRRIYLLDKGGDEKYRGFEANNEINFMVREEIENSRTVKVEINEKASIKSVQLAEMLLETLGELEDSPKKLSKHLKKFLKNQ
jgi:hypothetical protein